MQTFWGVLDVEILITNQLIYQYVRHALNPLWFRWNEIAHFVKAIFNVVAFSVDKQIGWCARHDLYFHSITSYTGAIKN